MKYKRRLAFLMGSGPMKYRREGFEEARAEALRIAETFVAAEARAGRGWAMKCERPEPDEGARGFDRRKPIAGWKVWVRPVPPEGVVIDGGDGYVLVDLESKQARWSDCPA